MLFSLSKYNAIMWRTGVFISWTSDANENTHIHMQRDNVYTVFLTYQIKETENGADDDRRGGERVKAHNNE